ncbi:MAG: N-acetyltransferase [archaeon]|jgi:ribosomal protein S18 acetylase RimI-like enzyme|nr:N-acetyltransferase [archaeon]
MKIEKASEKDLREITQLISKDFPYVKRGLGKFKELINAGQIIIFKVVEKEKILGFCEVQFVEEGIARINGLSVKETWQGKGIGAKLLDHTLKFLSEKNIERTVLLVKQSNKRAKAMYEGRGFKFIGLYHRKLDNKVVEEMELGISGEAPVYVS